MIAAITTLVFLWAGLIGGMKWMEHRLNRANQNEPVVMQQYWQSPAFSFPDQDGKMFTDRDLRGHVWIADFFFSQCTTACPILTSKLLLLQKQLTDPGIRFVSFSVDPEHDTPAALKKYAQLWEGDESRWRLLSTDPRGLAEVAAGMKVAVAKTEDKENPIMHSTLFMLVDQQGQVRGMYDSIDNQALDRLVVDAKSLAGDSGQATANVLASGSTAVERGHALYGSMGCVACHSQVRIAPPLASVYGSLVRLDDRKMVWADDAYLHESIVDPNSKVVAGYSRTMPSYRSYLNDSQVMDLVEYIKSLSTNSPGGHGYVARDSQGAATQPELLVVADPVCKMQVNNDPSSPHATFGGKTYFFCSQHCREQFLKNPAKYALTKNAPQ